MDRQEFIDEIAPMREEARLLKERLEALASRTAYKALLQSPDAADELEDLMESAASFADQVVGCAEDAIELVNANPQPVPERPPAPNTPAAELLATRAARDQQDASLVALGGELRGVLPAECWDDLDEDERAAAVGRAVALSRERMGIGRATPVIWMDDPSERGFEETTGEVKLPRADLAGLTAEEWAGLIAHEMQHAWQWEVIEGRIDPPEGELERRRLRQAYAIYNTLDEFEYNHSELEQDARDRAGFVIDGFRGEAV